MPNQPTPNVLIAIISSFLESHKRLVVPQLGAFIVKEPGQVLFTELLKRDDGVLRGELRTAGLNELEAAGEIDRFVFEVRHAVSRGEEYRAEGLGTLKPGPNGTIVFDYSPRPSLPAAAETASEPTAPARPAAAPEKPAAEAALAPQHTAESPAQSASDAETPAEKGPAEPRTPAEPAISRSAKMHPDPSVRGLRYGRPQKSTDAYTYVDRPPRRRGADRFIWIAVLAIALAAAAIAFGLWREAQQAQEEEPAVRYETTLPVPHAGDDATQPADDAAAPDTPAAGTTQTPEEQ